MNPIHVWITIIQGWFQWNQHGTLVWTWYVWLKWIKNMLERNKRLKRDFLFHVIYLTKAMNCMDSLLLCILLYWLEFFGQTFPYLICLQPVIFALHYITLHYITSNFQLPTSNIQHPTTLDCSQWNEPIVVVIGIIVVVITIRW